MKLQLALDLREAGLSLQDIKDLFCLKADCACPEEASKRMSNVLNEQIDTGDVIHQRWCAIEPGDTRSPSSAGYERS